MDPESASGRGYTFVGGGEFTLMQNYFPNSTR